MRCLWKEKLEKTPLLQVRKIMINHSLALSVYRANHLWPQQQTEVYPPDGMMPLGILVKIVINIHVQSGKHLKKKIQHRVLRILVLV